MQFFCRIKCALADFSPNLPSVRSANPEMSPWGGHRVRSWITQGRQSGDTWNDDMAVFIICYCRFFFVVVCMFNPLQGKWLFWVISAPFANGRPPVPQWGLIQPFRRHQPTSCLWHYIILYCIILCFTLDGFFFSTGEQENLIYHVFLQDNGRFWKCS